MNFITTNQDLEITNIEAIKTFILAPKGGKACKFTLSSPSGKHFTYRIKSDKKDTTRFFVSVLTGSNNEEDFSFLGTIFAETATPKYYHGKKSGISTDAESAKGFQWLFDRTKELPNGMKFIPSCECARCGKTLTEPTSAAAKNSLGIPLGPTCRKHLNA